MRYYRLRTGLPILERRAASSTTMVTILRASEMGFCMGVRRAVQIMEGEATPERPVFSVGEIVHNPHVVRELEKVGVLQLPGPDEVDGDIGEATSRRVG